MLRLVDFECSMQCSVSKNGKKHMNHFYVQLWKLEQESDHSK